MTWGSSTKTSDGSARRPTSSPSSAEHLQLKRVGQPLDGPCPFHTEKSPSFSVNGEEGLYYCFGCGSEGDAITFVREMEHLDFAGAVETPGRPGRDHAALHRPAARASSRAQEGRSWSRPWRPAVAWYHERLLSPRRRRPTPGSTCAAGASTATIVRQYRIGWAPDDWDQLVQGARGAVRPPGRGRPGRCSTSATGARTSSAAGSCSRSSTARAIRWPSGAAILPGGDGPKYRNSSETPIYAKSKVLYGLNWAKGDIVKADEAIVCEGYTDVIGMARVGMARAVAPVRDLAHRGARAAAHPLRRSGSCSPSTPTRAGENAAARFYEWEQQVRGRRAGGGPARRARTPATWPRTTPTPCARRSRTPAVPALPLRPGAGRPGPGRRPRARPAPRTGCCRSSPSTPTRSCGTSTSWTSPAGCSLDRRPPAEPAQGRARPRGRGRRAGRCRRPQASGRELAALRLLVHRRAEIVDRLDADALRRSRGPGRLPAPGRPPARSRTRRRRPRTVDPPTCCTGWRRTRSARARPRSTCGPAGQGRAGAARSVEVRRAEDSRSCTRSTGCIRTSIQRARCAT